MAQEPEPTRLESAEEIQRALAARKKGKPAGPRAGGGPPPLPEAQRERPLQRPPMALLCIVDDGKQDGEWVRLRADRTVIGRADGDVRIPHDGQISTRHAEIVREAAGAGWRWLLVDANSTNGTFVRIGGTPLRHNSELLIGGGRFRFEAPDPQAPTAAYEAPAGTLLAYGGPQAGSTPFLVEVTPSGPGQRYPLSGAEHWIGSDPRLSHIARPGDPLLDPQHARFFRKGAQWHVENNGSANGLWLRMSRVALDRACQFRLGEQRFLFRTGD